MRCCFHPAWRCFASGSRKVRIPSPALSVPGLSQNHFKKANWECVEGGWMQITNLESQEIWAVPSGLVSVHYSPSAHTWEQMDLNFHLPHLGLPTSIPCSIVSLPIIRALFNMYWGEKKEGLWGQVGARLHLQGYFCLLGAQGERSWLSGISLAVSAPRSGTARAGVLGPPSFAVCWWTFAFSLHTGVWSASTPQLPVVLRKSEPPT